jgi:hypothetical protein
MNRSMDQLCEGYSDEQLELLAGFLHRTSDAGKAATEARAPSEPPRRSGDVGLSGNPVGTRSPRPPSIAPRTATAAKEAE